MIEIDGEYKLFHGNNKDVLKTFPDNSIDSVVTDPPYELGFMGKKWDATGIAYDVELWAEILRVLKPGGHLLAFSGSRTYHRMVVAIEDAGFEIRDQIMWIYGSGFPKSHNISKAIDKLAGAEREVVGTNLNVVRDSKIAGGSDFGGFTKANPDITAPATDEAKQWDGWGTALKPAHEPIVVARKPLIGTVVENVLTYGTGGLNIDGSRVGRAEGDDSVAGNRTATFGTQETQRGGDGSGGWQQNSNGRWPANVIHDGSDEVVELFPDNYGDSGSAARFFYCAKANKKDRNEGLDGFEAKYTAAAEFRPNHMEKALNGESGKPTGRYQPVPNNHPTVKPTDLMRYLCRLVTSPNGIVLDPFMGSGSTGKAAMLENFRFIGIELEEQYLQIAQARIEFANQNKEQTLFN